MIVIRPAVETCGNHIYKIIYSGFAGAVAISRI